MVSCKQSNQHIYIFIDSELSSLCLSNWGSVLLQFRLRILSSLVQTADIHCHRFFFLCLTGDQWDRYFFSFDPLFCHYWYKRRTFTIAVSSFCLILPLCFSKRIDFLKYVSAFGVATIVYINFLQVRVC